MVVEGLVVVEELVVVEGLVVVEELLEMVDLMEKATTVVGLLAAEEGEMEVVAEDTGSGSHYLRYSYC